MKRAEKKDDLISMPPEKSLYHKQGKAETHDPKNNEKYVTTDGKGEAVYNERGELVTDPVNQGTYNKKDPNSDPIGHFIDDVYPYIKWGNR